LDDYGIVIEPMPMEVWLITWYDWRRLSRQCDTRTVTCGVDRGQPARA